MPDPCRICGLPRADHHEFDPEPTERPAGCVCEAAAETVRSEPRPEQGITERDDTNSPMLADSRGYRRIFFPIVRSRQMAS
jgi:hypothetical protein